MRGRTVLIASFYAVSAVPACACEWDPFLFQLPGETVEQASERSKKIHPDLEIVHHFHRETQDYETASVIYLARVISRKDDDRRYETSAIVRPLHSLKGALPTRDRTLTGQAAGGLCTDRGDGTGAFGTAGDLVVVFENVPRSENRPRGVDSFPAMEIRSIDLLDKLREFGKDLED
jgi:hypothetical protein